MIKTRSSSARRIAAIQAALYEKPMTAREIGEAIYLNYSSTACYLAHLRQEPKRIYVADWRDCNYQLTPVYAWGDSEDVPRPIPMTRNTTRTSALGAL